jgi:hypothetical protein
MFLAADHPRVLPQHGQQWGSWTLNTERFTLEYKKTENHYPGGPDGYEIYLEQVTDVASMADAIFRIQRKSWASSEDVGDLVKALDKIFNPGPIKHNTKFDPSHLPSRFSNPAH